MKTLNLYFKNLHLFFSTLSIFILLSFPNYSFDQTILYGDSLTLGDGVVRTFVRVNALGRREQIGVSMTDGVMNNLDTILQSFDLALPTPVATDDTTFNHVFFIWNPRGHLPPGINEVPHFDFHFSTVSVAECQAAIPGIDPVYYPSEFTPRDYRRDNFPPGVVANRGLHWSDTLDPHTNQTFKTSFTITTYRGKRFHWVPQITRAFLLTNPDTLISIKQAKLYRQAGDYPLNYSITHDPVNHTYNVVLRTFVHSEGVTTNPFIGISNGMVNGISEPLGCGSIITGGDAVSVDFDITASDWDIGDSVTLTASFSPPTGGFSFIPSLPVKGYPAKTHLHFVSNGEYFGTLNILATDLAGNTTSCNIRFDFPLPVELTSFGCTIHENDVTLNWMTASERNNSGFDIERRDARGETQDVWSKVGFVEGNGTSTTSHNYSYNDKGLNSGKYNYRLKQIDFNGNFEYFNLSNEVVVGIPGKFELQQNYPNPFNPNTVISYQLAVNSFASLKIYDVLGNEVSTLVNEKQDAGYYAVDFIGSNLASGVYFYKLAVDGKIIDTKRMILLK